MFDLLLFIPGTKTYVCILFFFFKTQKGKTNVHVYYLHLICFLVEWLVLTSVLHDVRQFMIYVSVNFIKPVMFYQAARPCGKICNEQFLFTSCFTDSALIESSVFSYRYRNSLCGSSLHPSNGSNLGFFFRFAVPYFKRNWCGLGLTHRRTFFFFYISYIKKARHNFSLSFS